MSDSTGKIDFTGFVAGLAATAAATLNQVNDLCSGGTKSTTGEHEDVEQSDQSDTLRTGMASTRHLIDTLAMLAEKTRGNLSADEEQLLNSALNELRISFVRVSDRVRTHLQGER